MPRARCSIAPRARRSIAPRVRRNGAVVKLSSSSNAQRTARSVASRVVDSTSESSDNTSEDTSGDEEDEEESEEEASVKEEPEEEALGKEESEEALVKEEPEAEGIVNQDAQDEGRRRPQSSAGPQRQMSGASQVPNSERKTPHHSQGAHQQTIHEDSFIVTSFHHRPWGAGDDNATVGVYSTESEARAAAQRDFQRVERSADGWESEWRRSPGDGTLRLCGRIEDGERDIEKYTATVQHVLQKRAVPVLQQQARRPSAASAPVPRVKKLKPRWVYIVKTEQWRLGGKHENAQRFDRNGSGLESREVHGIYLRLDDANDAAVDLFDSLKGSDGRATDLEDFIDGMADTLVLDMDRRMIFRINVKRRPLK